MIYDRRKKTRWQINQRALLKLKQAANESYCQIKDINYVGAQIILHAKLPLETIFKMSLRLSENYTIEAKVWVAWQKTVNGSNHYGLYFSQINDADKDKINKFINTFYPNNDSGKIQWLETAETNNKKGGEEMNDHRIFERFRKEFSARFIGLDGKEGLARTFDVSAKGLGLSTNQELESQANLEIWLDVPNSTDPLYTRGQVVWTRLAGQGGYQSGIELERADLMGISRLLRA
ncbi:MAG: PilZ domain-containing protein [Candidatus Omnitrophota bacterium]